MSYRSFFVLLILLTSSTYGMPQQKKEGKPVRPVASKGGTKAPATQKTKPAKAKVTKRFIPASEKTLITTKGKVTKTTYRAPIAPPHVVRGNANAPVKRRPSGTKATKTTKTKTEAPAKPIAHFSEIDFDRLVDQPYDPLTVSPILESRIEDYLTLAKIRLETLDKDGSFDAFYEQLQAAEFLNEDYKALKTTVSKPTKPLPDGISILCATHRPEDLENILTNFRRQTFENRQLILIPNGGRYKIQSIHERIKQEPSEIQEMVTVVETMVDVKNYLAACLNEGAKDAYAKYNILTKWDGDDKYGAAYLWDVLGPYYWSDADVSGLRSIFYYWQNSQEIRLRTSTERLPVCLNIKENQPLTTFLPAGSTLTFRKTVVADTPFREPGSASDDRFRADIIRNEYSIASVDVFNHILRRSADHSVHTFNKVSSLNLIYKLSTQIYENLKLNGIFVNPLSTLKNVPDIVEPYEDFDESLYRKHFPVPGQIADLKNYFYSYESTGVKPASEDEEDYVVSLTSWPPRTDKRNKARIWVTIESLLQQSKKPQRIILWLSKLEYPEGEKHLPLTLLHQKKRGLEIIFVEDNEKAAKKILPFLRSGIEANVVTADDDIVYDSNWLATLVQLHKKNPAHICALAGRIIDRKKPYTDWKHLSSSSGTVYGGHNNIIRYTGCGTLYPFMKNNRYNGLHPMVVDRRYKNLYETNDDLWLFACSVMQGTPVVFGGKKMHRDFVFRSLPLMLSNANLAGKRNDLVFSNIIKEFPGLESKIAPKQKTLQIRKAPSKTSTKRLPVKRPRQKKKLIPPAKAPQKPPIAPNWDALLKAPYKPKNVHPHLAPRIKDHLLWRSLRVKHKNNFDAFKKAAQRAKFSTSDYKNLVSRIEKPRRLPTGISVLCATHRPQDLENILSNFRRQNAQNKELVLIPNGGYNLSALENRILKEPENIRQKIKIVGEMTEVKGNLAACLNKGAEAATYDLLSKMDGDDIYGEWYLEEIMDTFRWSNADVSGKRCPFYYWEGQFVGSRINGSNTIISANIKDRGTSMMALPAGGTLTFWKDVSSKFPFRGKGGGSDIRFYEDCLRAKLTFASADAFNYLMFRSRDASVHTCNQTDMVNRIKGTCKRLYSGLNINGVFV